MQANAPADLPVSDTNGTHTEAPPGNGGGKRPVFKVGPITTSKDNAVAAYVWANEATANGQTFTVYNVTVDSRYRDATGEWKSGKNYRGSQLHVLVYCLQRCSDWILAQRDPAQDCPF